MVFYNNDNDGSVDLEVDFDKNVTNLYESISESDWDVAISDVKNNPREAKTWVVRHHENGQIMWRFLPIHSACARQPPENVVNALMGAYRLGAQCTDDQGMLPLHYACGNQASVEIIRMLLLAYPDAANIADPNGMLPLHYVAQWGPSSADVIDVLLFANSNAVKARDREGNAPIDLARDGDYEESQKSQVIQALQRLSHPVGSSEASTLTPSMHSSMPSHSRNMPSYSSLGKTVNKDIHARSMNNNSESQPTDLKSFTSMPKTSEAVRRLQEAAAAQQNARESYLRSSGSMEVRDESSTVGSLPTSTMYASPDRGASRGGSAYMRYSGRSTASNDDVGTAYTMDSSSQRMVSTLKAEVEKLREEAKRAEAEAQKQIDSERAEMQKAVDEMKAKLASCEKETVESLSELTAKEEFGKYIETRLKDKESELESAMKRNEHLRNEVENMKKNISKYKEKSAKLDEHLLALSKSMASMMEEQQQIMQASARHEEHMKKVSLARQKKMQELIDQEVAFARVSLDRQKQSDLGSEEMINAALDNQRKLMSAVAEVLIPKGMAVR